MLLGAAGSLGNCPILGVGMLQDSSAATISILAEVSKEAKEKGQAQVSEGQSLALLTHLLRLPAFQNTR